MNSPSDKPDEPVTSMIACDGCGKVYEEMTVLVWGRQNFMIARLLCIECDPTASKQPRVPPHWTQGPLE